MTVLDITERDAWENFISAHPEANFLHSWQWGEFHSARGKLVVRRGVFDGEKLLGVYEGQVETARLGTFMAITGGPIIDWQNKTAVAALFVDIKSMARQLGCVFVRIRPQLEKSEGSLKLFKDLGLKRSPMYLSVEHAGILDLTKNDEELVANMRERLRRALKKAGQASISVDATDNPEAIDEFYKIQLETAGRHSFVPFGKEFLKKQFAAFAQTGNALLYTARHDGEILAQNFMIFYNQEAAYHYGVSTKLGTQLSGAPLLHMEAIAEAKKRGCSRYNFWGIVGEEETKHRFYGVSTFKRGFGVEDLLYTPAHDLVINHLRYLLPKIVESFRRKHRRV